VDHSQVSAFLTVPCDAIKTRVHTAPDADLLNGLSGGIHLSGSPRLVASFSDAPLSKIADTVAAMLAQVCVILIHSPASRA